MLRAESIRVMHDLFQGRQEGSIPISALKLWVNWIDTELAIALNRAWHSRMPRFGRGSVNIKFPSFAASFDGVIYAVAIWSNPCARLLPQQSWLELRRFAIAPDAPRNTASRMLGIMTRIIRKEFQHIVKLISYQDTQSHTGGIYRAVGWKSVEVSNSNTDWTRSSRSRPESQSTAKKIRWEIDIR